MPFAPYTLANLRAGQEQDVDAWLLPQDGFTALENWYLYHGRLTKRNGYALFGSMVHAVNAATLGTGDGNTKTFAGTLAYIPVRTTDFTATDGVETFTDPFSTGILAGSIGGHGTINYTTGVYSITFENAPSNDIPVTATYNYFPGLPVMGAFNYSTAGGGQTQLVFNTRRMNRFDPVSGRWVDVTGYDVWTGTNSNFFWVQNWQNNAYICNNHDQLYVYDGTTLTPWVIDTINFQYFASGLVLATGDGVTLTFSGTGPFGLANFSNMVPGSFGATDGVENFIDNGNNVLTGSLGGSGTINYTTGAWALTFNTAPAAADVVSASFTYNTASGANHVTGCCFIAQWKDRLILFAPTEDGVPCPQRIRWCYVGEPNVWPANNYLDSDTTSILLGGAWISDNILGFFDRGVMLLMYLGEQDLPFFWKVVAANEGILAATTPLALEDEVFFLSITRFATTDGNQVNYIDAKLPNFILNMNQSLVHFAASGYLEPKNQAWFCYPSLAATEGNDKVLVLNTEDNSWAVYDLALTCFGYYELGNSLTWADLTDITWAQWNSPWGAPYLQGGYPIMLGGDANGNVWQLDQGTLDAGVNPVNATATTGQLNPFVKQGHKARLQKLKILCDTNAAAMLTVNFYIDSQTTAYQSIQVPMTDNKGGAKSWLSIPSMVAGEFHQFDIVSNGQGGGAVIHAIVPYFSDGGPIDE